MVLKSRWLLQLLSPGFWQLRRYQRGQKERHGAKIECPTQSLGFSHPSDHKGRDRTHGSSSIVGKAQTAGSDLCGINLAADDAGTRKESCAEESNHGS